MTPEEEARRKTPYGAFWRVGRKVGRTIYAQYGEEPRDTDQLLGMMDTRGLAQAVVDAHNERERKRRNKAGRKSKP